MSVIKANPDYGIVISCHAPLRKLRVRVEALNCGQSGGYRAIYQSAIVGEEVYVVLLSTYYKGDQEDLDSKTYESLVEESRVILSNVLGYDWT
jgi:hypothetical protein